LSRSTIEASFPQVGKEGILQASVNWLIVKVPQACGCFKRNALLVIPGENEDALAYHLALQD